MGKPRGVLGWRCGRELKILTVFQVNLWTPAPTQKRVYQPGRLPGARLWNHSPTYQPFFRGSLLPLQTRSPSSADTLSASSSSLLAFPPRVVPGLITGPPLHPEARALCQRVVPSCRLRNPNQSPSVGPLPLQSTLHVAKNLVSKAQPCHSGLWSKTCHGFPLPMELSAENQGHKNDLTSCPFFPPGVSQPSVCPCPPKPPCTKPGPTLWPTLPLRPLLAGFIQ